MPANTESAFPCGIRSTATGERLAKSELHHARSHPSLAYHLYLPPGGTATKRVLVTVHGVSRNADEHIALFRDMADQYGTALIAPVFELSTFRDFQRLGRSGHGLRADLALIRVLNDVQMRYGISTDRVDMFGFSGGAQFAHRFAYAHSGRVRRLTLGAAGWYTMPDMSVSYPYGTKDSNGLDQVRLRPGLLAAIPTLVLVGGLDDQPDDELNQSRRIRKMQGANRVERAKAWVGAINAYATRSGHAGQASLSILPGVRHSFQQAVQSGNLAGLVFEHCYGRLPTRHPL